MKKRFFWFLFLIILISVLGTVLISSLFTIKNYIDDRRDSLADYSRLMTNIISEDHNKDSMLEMDKYAELFSSDTGYRITIIDANGVVLADSVAKENYKNMENHSDREEFREALTRGSGNSTRISRSFGNQYIYSANLLQMRGDDILVVRASMEINRWEIVNEQIIIGSLVAVGAGILLALIIAFLYTNRLMKPVRQMEAKLEKSMEENEKAENIRREFVSNVTHELKTPLTSIAGFVETMQDDPEIDMEARTKFLNIISLEASRLERLIDDILIISDIESGKESNTDEDINVKQAVKEVVESLEPLSSAKGITLNLNSEYEMYIGGNYDRFKQMMVNVIENAIKYSGDGKNVYINLSKEGVMNPKVMVSIEDEGIGISDENIERLFERFYRVDKSRSKNVGGTGLGLAIVKHIAMLFGAEIKVESKIGKGSKFTIIFPS